MELRTSKYGAESMSSSRNSSYSVSYNGRSPSDSEPAHWQAGCRLFKLLTGSRFAKVSTSPKGVFS